MILFANTTKLKPRYFHSQTVSQFREIILSNINSLCITNGTYLSAKSAFFNLFGTNDFKSLYFQLTKQVAISVYGSTKNICVQTTPTPRIFLPGSHGTSIHCDYWYGHGITSTTVWVPIFNCVSGSTFYADLARTSDYDPLDASSFGLANLESVSKSIFIDKNKVLPDSSSCFIFDSLTLHGSDVNESNVLRLSFDFRICKTNDNSSTKDLKNYYHLDESSESFYLPVHPLSAKPCLKYIVGGNGRNTFAQHIIIDQASKRYGFLITDQEAEVERYGFPILTELITSKSNLSEKYHAIIIASKSLLDQHTSSLLSSTSIDVYFCLENEMITSTKYFP